MAVQCQCQVVSGCWVTTHTEVADRSVFRRIWVRGPQAQAVLTDILRRSARPFHAQYLALDGSGMTWPTLNGGWCGLLCGRVPKPPSRQGTWTPGDVARLRAAYQASGMPGCQAAFPDRTYDAITATLKRHKIWAERWRRPRLLRAWVHEAAWAQDQVAAS